MCSQVNDLYQNILHDFIISLQSQNKRKGFLDQQKIDSIKQSIDKKLKNVGKNFKVILQQYLNAKKQLFLQQVVKNQFQLQKKQAQDINQLEDDEVDDLIQFNSRVNRNQQQPIQDSQNQMSMPSQSSDQNFDVCQIKQKIGIHIIGQYLSDQKKFNSKTSQTTIQIQNAFVKAYHYEREIYFPHLKLSMRPVDKDQINK